jgi:hypothetical protein
MPAVTTVPIAIASRYSGQLPITPITQIPPCGACSVALKANDSAPVTAEPVMSAGMTRSGSAAAKGIAPSVMNDAPMTQAPCRPRAPRG